MRTVAEHVHSEAILELLREMGVDYAQGYILGRPAPIEELTSGPPADPAAPPASRRRRANGTETASAGPAPEPEPS